VTNGSDGQIYLIASRSKMGFAVDHQGISQFKIFVSFVGCYYLEQTHFWSYFIPFKYIYWLCGTRRRNKPGSDDILYCPEVRIQWCI